MEIQKLQILWYILHTMMHNPDTQKSRFVGLSNIRGTSSSQHDPRFSYRSTLMERAFPIQMIKFHICYANVVFPLVARTIQAISNGLSRTLQSPVLLHNGSDERALESLSEHDLPTQCLPIEIGERRNKLSIPHEFIQECSYEIIYYST